jgi:hypothetical protein
MSALIAARPLSETVDLGLHLISAFSLSSFNCSLRVVLYRLLPPRALDASLRESLQGLTPLGLWCAIATRPSAIFPKPGILSPKIMCRAVTA